MNRLHTTNALPNFGSGPTATANFEPDASNPNGLFVSASVRNSNGFPVVIQTRLSTEDTRLLRNMLNDIVEHGAEPEWMEDVR